MEHREQMLIVSTVTHAGSVLYAVDGAEHAFCGVEKYFAICFNECLVQSRNREHVDTIEQSDGPGVDWAERRRPFGAGQDPSNIVDAGYAVGSIQIPGGSQPIILHREAVSGGGYAQVGTVISADMDVVARSAPGTKTRFVSVNMDEALAARKAYQDQFNKIWS